MTYEVCIWHCLKNEFFLLISLFLLLLIGVSTGQSGLGLCPNRNRPASIGWTAERPTADRKRPRVESDRTPVDNGRVGRPRTDLQSPDFRRIEAENQPIKPRFERKSRI